MHFLEKSTQQREVRRIRFQQCGVEMHIQREVLPHGVKAREILDIGRIKEFDLFHGQPVSHNVPPVDQEGVLIDTGELEDRLI